MSRKIQVPAKPLAARSVDHRATVRACLVVALLLGLAGAGWADDCQFDDDPSVHDLTSSSVKIEWSTNQSGCGYTVFLTPEGSTCSCPDSVGPCPPPEDLKGPPAGSRVLSGRGAPPTTQSGHDESATFDDLAADQTYYYWVILTGDNVNKSGHFTTLSDNFKKRRVRRAGDSDPEDEFEVLPFLQNPLDGKITIAYQTDESQSIRTVLALPYGASCGDDDLTGLDPALGPVTTSFEEPLAADSSSPDHVYHQALSNLSPDSKYWYWVILEGEDQLVGGGDYNFISFDDSGTSDAYTFFVYGDNRSQPTQAGWVVQAMQNQLYSSSNQSISFPRFIVSTGDYAYDGCSQSDWLSEYFGPAQPLLKNIAVFTAPGNHEYSDCSNAGFYFGYFADPDGEDYNEKEIYSFDYQNGRFLSLDIISTSDDGDLHHSSFEDFVDDELTETTGIDHIFAFYHAPMLTQITTTGHSSSSWQIANLAPWLQGDGGGKVAAVFSGHNHFYERSYSLLNVCPSSSSTNSYGVDCSDYDSSCGDTNPPPGSPKLSCLFDADESTGITYVLSGGGGAPLYPVPSSSDYAGWLAVAEKEYHYVTITVDDDEVTGYTTSVNGSSTGTIDSFTLRD